MGAIMLTFNLPLKDGQASEISSVTLVKIAG